MIRHKWSKISPSYLTTENVGELSISCIVQLSAWYMEHLGKVLKKKCLAAFISEESS